MSDKKSKGQSLIPSIGESLQHFIRRNLKNADIVENYPRSKRVAACKSIYEEGIRKNKVSFELENCLVASRTKTIRKILELIDLGVEVHVMSSESNLAKSATALRIMGLTNNKIHVVESMDAKVNKIIELRATAHFDTCSEIAISLSSKVAHIASINLTWSVFPTCFDFRDLR